MTDHEIIHSLRKRVDYLMADRERLQRDIGALYGELEQAKKDNFLRRLLINIKQRLFGHE